jgi:hypothetical protein
MKYATQPEETVTRVLGRWRRLAWLPIPLLLTVIVALWVADLRTVYESRVLMVLLNLSFTWLASLFISILTARGFITTGQPGLLMFGCGSLLWGSTSLAAALIVGPNANPTITVHNLGVLGASLCHFAGMVWPGRLSRPGRWLTAGSLADCRVCRGADDCSADLPGGDLGMDSTVLRTRTRRHLVPAGRAGLGQCAF